VLKAPAKSRPDATEKKIEMRPHCDAPSVTRCELDAFLRECGLIPVYVSDDLNCVKVVHRSDVALLDLSSGGSVTAAVDAFVAQQEARRKWKRWHDDAGQFAIGAWIGYGLLRAGELAGVW